MALTPVELRHITFGRRLFGYRRASVDELLTEVVDSFEDVWRDRADLADKVEQLENDLVRYRELETLLRTTLVSAERAAHDMKAQAKQEATLIVGEAQAEARSITRTAREQRDRMDAEAARVRALLRTALETVEAAAPEAASEAAENLDAPTEDPLPSAGGNGAEPVADEAAGADRWEAA
jgi:cell division initiation protein